ncbi:MAG: polymer-forming cytoskeletal protein [Candidatus Saccharibacteria bacterium]|nr:polymer-forming cytoskeletal protein [Pseudorhodobacter sp.]
MFSKTPEPTSANPAPAVPNRGPSGNTKSVLAQDLRITGEISSTGTIEVLGEIEGNLTARGLIVGLEGRVAGTVSAETVEVKGRLDGRVATHDMALRATAEVAADVSYTTLVIENGALIEGKFMLNKA